MAVEEITIGPYRQGSIPPPITHTYEDSGGNPIDLTGFVGKFEYKRWGFGQTPVDRDADVADDQVNFKGQVTYTWSADDLDTAGDYLAEMWVGNSNNRYASLRIRWIVLPAIQVPVI